MGNLSVSGLLAAAIAIVSQIQEEKLRLIGVLVISALWVVHTYIAYLSEPPKKGGDTDGEN